MLYLLKHYTILPTHSHQCSARVRVIHSLVTCVQTSTVLWIKMLNIKILWKLNNCQSIDPNFTVSLSLLTSDMALTFQFERSSDHSTPTTTTLALLSNFSDIFLHFCEHCFNIENLQAISNPCFCLCNVGLTHSIATFSL